MDDELTTLCVACINDFLDNHSVNELGDELEDLKNKDVFKNLCDEHRDRNLFNELNKVRELIQ